MEIAKRTGGKNKGCLGPMVLYKYYLKHCYELDKRAVPYSKFSKIIKGCNREMMRLCTEESEIVRLPFRLGYLQVVKREKGYDLENAKIPIDWQRTKKEGFIVYYESKYLYKWTWLKKTSLVKNKSKYKFEACREAKRRVPYALKKLNVDFFGFPHQY